MAFTLYVLDSGIVRQYLDSWGEYWASVRRPFRIVPFFELWRCEQRNWADAYKEWRVLQLYSVVLFALLVLLLLLLMSGPSFAEMVGYFAILVPIVYIIEHLSWFSVAKRHGCFCCFVACEYPPLLLLWGLLDIASGVLGVVLGFYVAGSMYDFRHSDWPSIVLAVPLGLCAIASFQMGLCCVKLWLLHGTSAASASEAQDGLEAGEYHGSIGAGEVMLPAMARGAEGAEDSALAQGEAAAAEPRAEVAALAEARQPATVELPTTGPAVAELPQARQPATVELPTTGPAVAELSQVRRCSLVRKKELPPGHLLFSGRFDGSEGGEKLIRAVYAEMRRRHADIPVFIVTATQGQAFGRQTIEGIMGMHVMAAFCGSNYGEDTASKYSTYFELKHAYDHDIPIIPIKLCQEWPPKGGNTAGYQQNGFVFKPDLVYLDLYGKSSDPAAVADHVATAYRQLL